MLSASVNLATKSAAVTVAPGGPSATSLAALLTAAGLQATGMFVCMLRSQPHPCLNFLERKAGGTVLVKLMLGKTNSGFFGKKMP